MFRRVIIDQTRFQSTQNRNRLLLSKLLSNPFELVIDQDREVPNLKDFTSNPNHKLDLSKFNQLKPVTPNDSYVSCTVFDKYGNNTAISKKYHKMQFLKDHNLFPRDLRKIDTSTIDVAPQIMVRPPSTILINLLHIKALIKKDKVMIFDTSTPEIATKLGLFIYDLELKLKNNSSNVPYEFKALESILINVMGYLEAELRTHIQSCGVILSELEHQVDRKKLQDLLIKLKSVQSYYQKSLLIKGVLDDLLENDEDLTRMYLNNPRDVSSGDTEELENMLESYYGHCDEFVQQSGSLVNDIKSTEDIVNIILDANRNALMLFELKVTIYTLGITVATLLPAFYGMNLKNFIEESNYGFGAIVLISIIQGLLITIFNVKTLQKVQRLTMMTGNTGRFQRNRGLNISQGDKWNNWRNKWSKLSKINKLRNSLWFKSRSKMHHPTSRERDYIWRMINENKDLK